MIKSFALLEIKYCLTVIPRTLVLVRTNHLGFAGLAKEPFSKWSTRPITKAENLYLTKWNFLQDFHKTFCGKQIEMTPGASKKYPPLIFNNKSSLELVSEGINTEQRIIGTHDGTFHCDEVTACVMLRLLPQYADAVIVRTRKENLLNEFNIVVDVGAVYDPIRMRLDHHQRSFNECMNSLNSTYPWVTKLSSAGLVYFHYGHELLASVLKLPVDSEEVNCIFQKVYENFIEEIDGIDNGIDAYHKTPRYSITTNISARVGNLNPPWNSDTDMREEIQFGLAYHLVQEELMDKILYYHNVWWPAREIVHNSIADRFQTHPGGEIIEFKRTGCPWKEHLMSIEEELNIAGKIKFVLYTDNSGNWRVQTVPLQKNSFDTRLPLKKDWWGLRNEQLDQVSRIKDCIFVHANGFIGGHKERKGALEMAVASIDAVKSETCVT